MTRDRKRTPAAGGSARTSGARAPAVESEPSVSRADMARLAAGEYAEPHRILGAHTASRGAERGVVIRAFHPDASAVDCLLHDGRIIALEPLGGGVFAGFVPGASLPVRYRLRFRFAGGGSWERGDPYRFLPTLGDVDLHLFNEGTHLRLWDALGAHVREVDGERGTSFAVWAPTARRVSVVGDFNGWDGRLLPMRSLGASGVFELFVPGVEAGAMYKFEILTAQGALRVKSDPFAFAMELPPGNASRVAVSEHRWSDDAWVAARESADPARGPLAIYEVHLGSWMRGDDGRVLSYREIAPALAEHVRRLGFTHIELLPIAEHPFTGSWGYQVTGYFAPTARYGTPDDFRLFVDTLHAAGIGVLLDWVPAHFPRDDFALRRFDGTALFEHDDPRLGEHPDWGTLIFNYARNEVRNFLVANALYWLEEFHIDGLRVDAVASMLYLDYSRRPGEWLRNKFGGRENLDAIEFLRTMNRVVHERHPGCITVAEESTAWPGVTKPVEQGGLGFSFKWNMGWMHDTLGYFARDPMYRSWHQNDITFAMIYEYSERFIMPLSHDEVVHLKRSLLAKMPNAEDPWRQFANLRLLLAYLYTRPGKKLLFMGSELAPPGEWNHDVSLPWHLAQEPARAAFLAFVESLGRLYREQPALWREDYEPHGFQWIDVADAANSVVSYVRRVGDEHVVVVLNMTPIPREQYRIGAPAAGAYVELLSSDDSRYGGSEVQTPKRIDTDPLPLHGFEQSMALVLPPLGAVVLAPAPRAG